MAPAEFVSSIVLFEVKRGPSSTCAFTFTVADDKSMKKTIIDEMDAHSLLENFIS